MRQTGWLSWLVAAAGFGLGLLALLVALSELSSGKSSTERWISVANLLTGLSGVVGAAGFGFGKRWGTAAFAVSVVGHVITHIGLISGLAEQGRLTVFSLVGLAFIPLLAALLLAAMGWMQRKKIAG